MKKEPKDHYTPVFYLRQWARTKGELCEFTKPGDQVETRMVGPAGTGHVHGLNTVEGLPPAETRYLEEVFFQIADDGAARVLKKFLRPPCTLNTKQRSAWSRFIMALMVRNPECLEKYKKVAVEIFQDSLPSIEAAYAKDRKPTDPPTYAEYANLHGPNPAARTIVRVVQHLADNPDLGLQLNRMRWTVLHNPNLKTELLTSDRPWLTTNGIGPPKGELLIPISPFHLFVATNNWETEMKVRAVWDAGEAVEAVNDRVASQARKYVYGTDDKQFEFVSTRLGRQWTADPTESLTHEQLVAAAREGAAKAAEE
jgi:Protein of unknown function (DUF4238)